MPALLPLLTTALLAAAVPAQSAPAPASGLRLSAKPDPAAPATRTPKIVFTLLGTVKHRFYNVELHQTSGQSALNDQGLPIVCEQAVGRFSPSKARGDQLRFAPVPFGGYAMGASSPCTGMYDGKLTTPRRGAPNRVLQTFHFSVPAMRITQVHTAKR